MSDDENRSLVLAALTAQELAHLLRRHPPEQRRGRPWSKSRRERVVIACAALRTNLTMRELAAVFAISKSAAHRIVRAITPRLAALAAADLPRDRRASWVVDGTLIPTRDHRRAARSKNYRWSCNAQVLVRRRDLWVVATTSGGPGNRNDPIHYRGSHVEALCRAHVVYSPTVGIEACPSSSHPGFAEIGSCATQPGAATDGAARGWNTRSRA